MDTNYVGFSLLGVFLIFMLIATAFWIWMLVDCAQNEPSEGNDRTVWILIIVLTGVVGAVIYFFARRPNRPPGKS